MAFAALLRPQRPSLTALSMKNGEEKLSVAVCLVCVCVCVCGTLDAFNIIEAFFCAPWHVV